MIRKTFLLLITILIAGFILPENAKMPVEGASKKSFHPESFWYYPWGKSGTHKGIDIFAKKRTPINSSTNGLVLLTAELGLGGKTILILGPKWRLHYYAHLNEVKIKPFSFVNSDITIATVGNTGNAKGKPDHLHYTIATIIPYLWRADKSPQGWKKIFYLNPIEHLQIKS